MIAVLVFLVAQPALPARALQSVTRPAAPAASRWRNYVSRLWPTTLRSGAMSTPSWLGLAASGLGGGMIAVPHRLGRLPHGPARCKRTFHALDARPPFSSRPSSAPSAGSCSAAPMPAGSTGPGWHAHGRRAAARSTSSPSAASRFVTAPLFLSAHLRLHQIEHSTSSRPTWKRPAQSSVPAPYAPAPPWASPSRSPCPPSSAPCFLVFLEALGLYGTPALLAIPGRVQRRHHAARRLLREPHPTSRSPAAYSMPMVGDHRPPALGPAPPAGGGASYATDRRQGRPARRLCSLGPWLRWPMPSPIASVVAVRSP